MLLAIGLFWLITDVRSPSGFQHLFAPLVFSVLVMTALVRVLFMLGLGRAGGTGGGEVGSWYGGGEGGGCGGDGGDGGGC